jgi:branched-subunit amino acid aminotransferase/4-amino-4-deoxychorismate lyase
MFVYLNGEYLPADEAAVSVWDGGFLYGDGIYTTLRLYQGRPVDLAAHYLRLQRHAAQLDLPLPVSEADFAAIAARLAARNGLTAQDGRLRITISRGGQVDDPLPLTDLAKLSPTVLVTLAPVGTELARWQDEGIGVVVLEPSYARGNFPALKTLNSLATVRALRRAAAAGCPEAILTARDGSLLEGAISNLFLATGGRLFTPARSASFLAGRTRERIFQIAAAAEVVVVETTLDRGHLEAADEVFTASSVREVLPVVTIDGRPVGRGFPGELTRLIQQDYRRAILAELASA